MKSAASRAGVVLAVGLLLLPLTVRAVTRIVEVRVEGNRRVETSAIRVHIHCRAGDVLDEEKIDNEVKTIYKMGFFDNVWVTSRETSSGTVLVYHVAERPYVKDIVFDGVHRVEVDDLQAVINVTARTIFDPQRAWTGLEQARKFYGSEGYPDAKIRYELEVDEDKNAVVHYYVEEGSLIRIKDIRFEGVKAFKTRKLRKLMTTRKKWLFSFLTGAGLLNEDELGTDIERLTAYYYDNGYIHVRIDEPKIERVGDGLVITIKVEEGPLFHVGEVRFEGDVLLPETKLRSTIGFREGEVFRASVLRDAIFALTEAYGNLGYAFAEIVPQTEVSAESGEVAVVFAFHSGPVVSIRRIQIRGNTKTRDHVIRRELALDEGEKFSGTGLQESKSRLRRLGYFDQVELTTSRTGKKDQVDLLVQVKEGRTGSFAAGAGFSSLDSLLFNARIAERNVLGRGQRMVLNADFGTIRQNFQFSFTEPWFHDRPLSVGLDLFDWELQFDRFNRGGRGGAIRASYPLRNLGIKQLYGMSLENVRLGLEYRLERARINGLSNPPPSVKAEEGDSLTSSLSPSLTRNTLDQPIDPTSGSRQSLTAQLAGLGGQSDFVKLELSGRWFFPLRKMFGGRVVYSVSGDLALGLGDSGASGKEVPLFERFFPGGINSVRGFDRRSLGPREEVCDSDGINCFSETVGGSEQLLISNELVIPLVSGLGLKGVVFFDAGNAFSAEDGIDPTKLRYAVGWGLRWLSPMGPLRVEIGYPLNRREDESSSRVHFSFGAPF